MTVLNEALHPAAFIVSEIDDHYMSRDAITIAPSQTIVVGQVLGRAGVVANESISAAAAAGNTGTGALTLDATAPITTAAIDGVYEVVMTTGASATAAFDVIDPNGIIIGAGAVGTTFSAAIKFAIADGTPHFAVGDRFLITVLRHEGADDLYYPVNASGTDGTQYARAIAIYPIVTGASAAKIAGLKRLAQVRAANLSWPSGATAAQIAEWTNQLAKLNIILR